MNKKLHFYLYLITIILLSSSPSTLSQTNTPTSHEVIVRNFAFIPDTIEIAVGDIVVFNWEGSATGHNVAQVDDSGDTSFNGGFRSGDVINGPFSWTVPDQYLQTNVTLFYICEPHVISHTMRGKIIVGQGSEDTAKSGNGTTIILAIFGASLLVSVVAIVILQRKK